MQPSSVKQSQIVLSGNTPAPAVCNDQFFTPAGLLIANGCVRVITLSKSAERKHGGPYVEFRADQIVSDNLRAITGPCPWHNSARHKFFYEFRSKCAANAMIYLQRQRVSYADYHIGLYYVALSDLVRRAAPAAQEAVAA